MLISILDLPHVPVGQSDFRSLMTNDSFQFSGRVFRPESLLDQGDIILGSALTRWPTKLRKVVYTCPHHTSVVEAVYEQAVDRYICLYVKLIGRTVDILASRKGLESYIFHPRDQPILTLGEMVASRYWRNPCVEMPSEFQDVVPIIHTHHDVYDFALQLEEAFECDDKLIKNGSMVNQLYNDYPHILTALIRGNTHKHLSRPGISQSPYVSVEPELWQMITQATFQNKVCSDRVHFNLKEFQEITRRIVGMRPAKFSVTMQITAIVSGLETLKIVNYLSDPYLWILPIDAPAFMRIRRDLFDIFVLALKEYAKFVGEEYTAFDAYPYNAAITIEKNIYDEVLITVRDPKNQVFVQFYNLFSISLFGTKALGYFKE